MNLAPVIGIDPGNDGGAVFLDASGMHVTAALKWRKTAAGFKVTRANGDTCTKPHLHAIGEMLRHLTRGYRYWVGVEGLFVPRPVLPRPGEHQGHRQASEASKRHTGQVRHVLTLAESTALVYGPLLPVADAVVRPTAAVWRPAILGLPRNASSKESEAKAIEACTKYKPPLVRGLGALGRDPHVAEAACIARWTWTAQVGKIKANGGRRGRGGAR